MATPPPPIPPGSSLPPLRTDDENSFPTLQVVVSVCAVVAFLILLLFLSSLAGEDALSTIGNGDGRGTGVSGLGEGGMGGNSKNGTGSADEGHGAGGGGPSKGGKQDKGEEKSLGPGGDIGDELASSKSNAEEEKRRSVEEVPFHDLTIPPKKSDVNGFISPQPESVATAASFSAEAGQSAEFFGTSADGNKFAYVVDVSSSMGGDRFVKARDELLDSLKKLNKRQKVFVVFFSDQTFVQPHDKMVAASSKKLHEWIAKATPMGGTDPLEALTEALAKRPDAIFVLSDGEFANSVVTTITNANKRKIVIHTIGFRTNATTLQELAERNRGVFRRVD